VLRGALDLTARGVVPGGTRRNLEAQSARVRWADEVGEADRILLADAQTSGGLLLAVPPARHEALLAALREERTPAAATIGRLTDGPAGSILVASNLLP
jgi:selenide,water dikinase